MASLFDTLQAQAFRAGVAPRTKDAQQWFQRNVKKLGDVNRRSLLKDDALDVTTKPKAGDMLMYFYDPKHKATLPYYDRFPLTIMVEPAAGGFYGLNMHYLPLSLRANLMDALYQTANNDRYDETTKLKISYKILDGAARYKEFRPCVKRYLNSQVQSKFMYVFPSEWDIALFLPTERFVGTSKASVWADSRRKII